MIIGQKINHSGRGVKQGETITVKISLKQIEFHIGQEGVGFTEIPKEFFNDDIYPYIALFGEGSRLRLEGNVQITST